MKKFHRTRKWLAVLLSVVLLAAPFANTSPAIALDTTDTGALTATPATASVVSEEVSLREQGSKHFLLSDGTYVAMTYDRPVHYEVDGEWVEIDNTLVSATLVGQPLTGTVKRDTELTATEKLSLSKDSVAYYENNANDFVVQLPQTLTANAPIMVNYKDKSLRFRFNGIADTAAAVTQPKSAAKIARELQTELAKISDSDARVKLQNDYATAVQKNRSAVAYASVKNNVDVNYYVTGQTLKEDIVLHAVPTVSSFAFDFTFEGLTAVLQEDNSVLFYDAADEAVFVVASPVMYDFGEGYSTDIAVTLTPTATGCRYTLTPSRAWLEDESRVYPVTLDPSVSTTQNTNYIHDCGVQQSNPTTNYKTLDRIYVGTSAGPKEGRMYFKLTQWPTATGMTADTIYLAGLNLSYYPQASWQTAYDMHIDVYQLTSAWDTNTITWNNQTGIGGTWIDSKYMIDSREVTSGSEPFNVTNWAKAHYANPSTDYGIRLQPYILHNELRRVCFISSDYYANTALRPLMRIYYNLGAGEADGLTSGNKYYLRNVNSNKYLTVINGNSTDGTDLVQYPFKATADQEFQIVYNSSTRDYSVYPMCASNSVVEITGGSSANNAVVQIMNKSASDGTISARFNILKNTDGTYRLLSSASTYTKAVVVQNASSNDSAPIIQYTDSGSTNGFWYFEPANKTILTNADPLANSNYNRAEAAKYAQTYGVIQNSEYRYIDGNDCTNFVSQCLVAGGMSMRPTDAIWWETEQENPAYWFYVDSPLGIDASDWISNSFTSATIFNQHWRNRAYQTIEYTSGAEAFADIDFLVWYLKKGDVIQIKASDTVFEHSMIIYSDDTTCDRAHRGVQGKCDNEGKKRFYMHNTQTIIFKDTCERFCQGLTTPSYL